MFFYFSSNLSADHIVETLFFLFESNDKFCQQILIDFLANILVLFPRNFEDEFDVHRNIISKFLKQVFMESHIPISMILLTFIDF